VIVAFLNHKGGVGKTALALHVAGAWAAQGKRIVVVDTDSQGSALDWSKQRAKEGLTRLFNVLELARCTVHAEAPEIARDVDHVVIDGSSHSAALMRSAMLAADLALVPAQPSPCDGWASGETLRLLQEARHFRPHLIARFVLNRCVARSLIAGQIAGVLAKHAPPALAARVGQRVAFADAARTGRLVSEMPRSKPAAREVAALAAEIERIAR
jgi:chromosome partitioning protein